LTIAMNVHSEVCLLDYGGGCELQPDKLRECYKLAASSIQQLCQSLETSLKQADEQALQERLQNLQHRQHPDVVPPPDIPKDVQGIPYYLAADQKDDFMQVEMVNDNDDQAMQAQNEAEEAYRRQALDYNVGHLTSKVREDDNFKKRQDRQAGSLLAAMLQSVKGISSPEEAKGTRKNVEDVSAPKTKVEMVPVQVDETKEKEQVEKKQAPKPRNTEQPVTSNAGGLDSDEEETTMQLESEFQTVPAPASKALDDDNDVDDLAAAIKKKKKKGKKGKK